jgi:integrase
MHVRLKGLNSRKKKLADGRVVTYWWAWKGGPRLQGEPGKPEFIASYNAAVAIKIRPAPGTMLSVLRAYEASQEFRGLVDRTRDDYAGKLRLIEAKYGSFPLAALTNPGARGHFKGWRDELAVSSLRQADYAWSVLARVLSWALDRGLVPANPCEKGGRLYHGSRAEKVWSAEQEAAFLELGPKHLHLPLLLALWTGQRQVDLLRLPWSAYDGARIRLRQSKTGARVVIPVGRPLKDALDRTAKCSPLILTNSDGHPWTADGFRSSWRKACVKAGVADVTFHDLRGTAVTRLALCGCTEAEISRFTGHSLNDVRSILDTHYISHDPALAENAIRKLERGTKFPD